MNMDFRNGTTFESSGSSSCEVFAVEARIVSNFPFSMSDGFIVDNNWRRIPFTKMPFGCGIPNPVGMINPIADQQHLFSYETAEALRNMFIAHCEMGLASTALETRLVKVQLITTWKENEIGVTPPMSPFSKRSIMLVSRHPQPDPVTEETGSVETPVEPPKSENTDIKGKKGKK